MTEKQHATRCGTIRYWVNEFLPGRLTLVFLPGLTADHRLFTPQLAAFGSSYNMLVWDAPGHAASWPFSFDFTLMDKAVWLEEILQKEGVETPVIIGQSMGGYVAQAYAQQFPGRLRGFVSIDSAPLQRQYMTAAELWLLKRMEPIYRCYPWKWLLKGGSEGVATTKEGRALMRDMMLTYEGDRRRYARLAGHGYRILAEAIEADLDYPLPPHTLLLCGEKDKAGFCTRYNKAWHRKTGLPLEWIAGAGHNSNTDAPGQVNALIAGFLHTL